ncbi:SLC6A2 [Cordylochernes scorpioides]|uniref:SLC6A2 n=1 Tax=Cordylochernes scorpioides TaxID=51811 RepID=A0ABY6LKT9_9ARAC|nr:SLC6A2 [Cordylochernes scorpioides]
MSSSTSYISSRDGTVAYVPGVFLIPYVILLVFGALPLFYMELVLGQYNRVGPISIWNICPIFKGQYNRVGPISIWNICPIFKGNILLDVHLTLLLGQYNRVGPISIWNICPIFKGNILLDVHLTLLLGQYNRVGPISIWNICPIFKGNILLDVHLTLLLGQYNRVGPISIWNICPIFKGVGYCSVLMSWYVSFYYNVIIGWTFYFMYSSFKSDLPWVRCNNEWNTPACWGEPRNLSGPAPLNRTSPVLEFFKLPTNKLIFEFVCLSRAVLELHRSTGIDDLGLPKWQLVLCVFSVFLILYFALFKGVKSSGKVVWVTATAPYIILTILLIRGVFLPGAAQGVAYYLRPEVSKLLDSQVNISSFSQYLPLSR